MRHSPLRWLVGQWQWPYATAFAAAFLLALIPVLIATAGWVLTLIYVQIPIYMLHQLEEHTDDRFRKFTNTVIGHGREVLSPNATFVINSVGVWGFQFAAFYLAVFVSPGWGLAAMYLPFVNSFGHVGQGIGMRRYNPGLWTAAFLFLPVSGGGLVLVSRAIHATLAMQLTGLFAALFVHALIIIHVKRELDQPARG
jgi:hypothetical protein